MQQNRPYIYNPGQKIEKSFAKASDGLAEGFQNLIDYKQKGYEQVKSIYDDRDVIMKDVNMFNSQELAKRTNDLLTETSSVIKSNGTIDFQKMGEIKRKVADIKQAKVNSELRVKAAEEVVKMTYANAANMKDPGATVTKLMATLKDPNSLFSPKNGYDEVMNLYKEGVDYATIMSNTLKKTFDRFGTVTRQYTNKAGDVKSVSYKAIPGFEFNTKTERMEPKPEPKADGTLTNPTMDLAKGLLQGEELEYFMRDLGAARIFNGDPYDYISDFVNQSIQGVAATKVDKYGVDIRKAASDAALKDQQFIKALRENSPEYVQLEKEYREAQTDALRGNLSARMKEIELKSRSQSFEEEKFNYEKNNPTQKDDNSPVIDEAGTYSIPFEFGDNKYKRMGKSPNGNLYIVPERGNPKIISEPEAKYIINSLAEGKRGAAKAAFKISGQQKAPVKPSQFTKFSDPKLVR